MRVFILCTGRSGSKSLIRACEYISNYTASHESLSKMIGDSRFEYPNQHIEADNRLAWFLGTLDKKYGKEAIYVHLSRDKMKVVNSFKNRWGYQGSILKAFSEGILMQGFKSKTEQEKIQIINDYYDTITNNIELFLKDKPHSIQMNLETISQDFSRFWSSINAEGDFESATASLDIPINTTIQSKPNIINLIKNKLKS